MVLRRAQAAHLAGRLADAERGYREILSRTPEHPQALGLLGLILAEGPDRAAAEAMLRAHLQVEPTAPASLLTLGRLRVQAGDDEAAIAFFERAADAAPALSPICNDLGAALYRLGRTDEALLALDRAVQLDPDFPLAQANRGVVLDTLGRHAEAAEALLALLARTSAGDMSELWAACVKALAHAAVACGRLPEAEAAVRRLLAGAPCTAVLWEPLAAFLDLAGRSAEARAVRNDIARRAGLQHSGRSDPGAVRVLVLGAVGSGHVPTRYLLDPAVFAIETVALLSPEARDAPLGSVDPAALQAADVVFSTLADVDRDGGQLSATAALCRHLGKPVINPPAAIHRTGRDHAAELFAGVPDLIVPQTRRASPQMLAAEPMPEPLLVRPAGSHGGDGLVLLRDESERDAFLKAAPPERLLATPFHDFRSPDGLWRKYRIIFVDRQPYPFHLAVTEGWLVHYWRAEMARSSAKRAEEAGFLMDWRGVFGARAAAAVEQVGRRLDLDYAGLDCALTADGEVLLFEANATILLHLDEPESLFPYKHAAVPAIRQAFTDLLLRRAGR